MPDHNADRELGQGQVVYSVTNTNKGIPIKGIKTGAGDLKFDKLGRCIVKDPVLAAEIRKDFPHDLTVSRIFKEHPADRGHRFHFGSMPAMPWHKFDEFGRRIHEADELESSDAQDESSAEEQELKEE